MHPCLVAGLIYMQQASRLANDAVVAFWVEIPYF